MVANARVCAVHNPNFNYGEFATIRQSAGSNAFRISVKEQIAAKKDWTPVSQQVNKQDLKLLLCAVRRRTLFCWHKWIYWTYGEATRIHRVCKKCYKREKNSDVLNKWDRWIDE